MEHVANFGRSLGLDTYVDKVGNIIIRKPATKGMESRKGIILQGHLDMVPQKNSGTNHNFESDPIQAYIDSDWAKANGTTLGADNGIGVAAAMAVLEDSSLKHGPIEALFTIDEETGMTGAFALEPNKLNGDILINLDSEDEGELYVGCAGGLDANVSFQHIAQPTPNGFKFIRVSITGLKGGHSGLDINKGRANAIKLLARLIYVAGREVEIRISSLEGGSLRNAIPREAYIDIGVQQDQMARLKGITEQQKEIFAEEFAAVETNIKVQVENIDTPEQVMDSTSQSNIIRALFGCPNGVIRMSDAMPGLVETSTNLARAFTLNGETNIQCLLRSSVDSAKEALANKMEAVFELAGANIAFGGAYPGWRPNMESGILKVMQAVYKEHFGITPEVKGIHAGLECGILGGIYPKLDMISFGPTIRNPHSPDEMVRIDTVEKFWRFLVLTLENAPD